MPFIRHYVTTLIEQLDQLGSTTGKHRYLDIRSRNSLASLLHDLQYTCPPVGMTLTWFVAQGHTSSSMTCRHSTLTTDQRVCPSHTDVLTIDNKPQYGANAASYYFTQWLSIA